MKARRKWAKRMGAWAFSLGLHLAALLAFIWGPANQPMRTYDEDVVRIEMVAGGSPPAGPAPAKADQKAQVKKKTPPKPKPPTPKAIVKARPAPPSRKVEPIPPAEEPEEVEVAWTALSEQDIAGAVTAGSGSGSGAGSGSGSGNGPGSGPGTSCDMVRHLQQALKKDSRVQQALARANANGAAGKAILLWNGDWTRTPGEDGKGLAGVREAIMVEVAFAPAACRAVPMSGHVVLALNDSPGAARVALGGGRWRWSDLLGRR
jgi:hypothetical protein